MTESRRLQLHAPSAADIHDLLAFEVDNRAHFETWVTARAPSYYSADAIAAVIEQARREREQDVAYQFLAKYDGQIIGRVNLTAVTRPHFNKAQLGYRIGQQFGGRGHASAIVALLLEQAFGPLELWRLESVVRLPNLASAKVLQRNGFHQYGMSEKAMQFDGAWRDLLYFEKRNEKIAI